MTISAPEPREKLEQLLGQTTESETGNLPDESWTSIRWDVLALIRFMSETPTWSFFNISDSRMYKALELFWSQFRPTRLMFESLKPYDFTEAIAEPMSQIHEELMLQCLKLLQRPRQETYKPDGDHPEDFEQLDQLAIQVHVAAARAMRLRRSDGLSDEVVDCLREAEQAVARIELRWLQLAPGDRFGPFAEGMPVYYISTGAVAALTFAELSRVSKAARDYSETLKYMAKAATYFDQAVFSNRRTLSERYSDEERETKAYQDDASSQALLSKVLWRSDSRPSASYSKSSPLHYSWSSLQFSLEEVADVFKRVRADRQSIEDWTQIADDCFRLANAEFLTWDEDEAWEDYGIELNWNEYWQRARGWAEAQLSEPEYRKRLRKYKRTQAESRLENYFFGGDWRALPAKAQERLITADVNWNSDERMSREAILNDLLRATEAMCYEFIWESLAESNVSSRALEYFLELDEEIANDPRRSTPSARDYVRMCKERFFPGHLREKELADDIKYMTKCLPRQIGRLNDQRNDAEHETGSTTPREVVDDCYRTFLGIGKLGVLPELARIGRKLRVGRRGGR